jgi:hypothetical protein
MVFASGNQMQHYPKNKSQPGQEVRLQCLSRAAQGAWVRVASCSPDREPSRLAARRNTPECSEDPNAREPWGPLRVATARDPIREVSGLLDRCLGPLIAAIT